MLAEAGCVSRRRKVEWSIYKHINVAVQKVRVTVEPRVMDTPQQWTPMHDITNNSKSPDSLSVHFNT